MLTITDDGTGIPPGLGSVGGPQPGLGLVGMRERATLAGGTLQVSGRPPMAPSSRPRCPPPGPATRACQERPAADQARAYG